MGTLFQDLKFGLRMLARNPGFTAVAVITLALGIGANTAIFSVVNAVLLRPLPYPHANQLVELLETNTHSGHHIQISGADFIDWRSQSHSFQGMAAYEVYPVDLSGGTKPVRVNVAAVSSGFFNVMGVRPVLGRWFLPQEHTAGGSAVVLGHGLWAQQFGSDPKVIGRTITVDGQDFTVVGVMPAGFDAPESAELWVPAEHYGPIQSIGTRSAHNFRAMARLGAGVKIGQARNELETIAQRLQQQYPNSNRYVGSAVVPLREQLAGDARPALLVLLGAVGFVLLIACADVANLLLARALARQKEIALRVALGATCFRIAGQLLVESVLLGMAGGALGLLLASWMTPLLLAPAPANVIEWGKAGLDWRVLLFALAISVLTGIICGIFPALRISKPNLNETLKESGSGAGVVARQHRLRGVLVVAEIALSLILLAGAGLMTRSFLNLESVDLGFRTDHILTATLSLPAFSSAYTNPHRVAAFYAQVIERVSAIPGVRSAGAIDNLPLGRFDPDGGFTIAGRAAPAHWEDQESSYRIASSEYFRVMGIPLLRGREFNAGDGEGASQVVVINQTMSRQFWFHQNPIGARIEFGGFDRNPQWMKVVGIVGDIRNGGPASEPEAIAYAPYLQHSESARGEGLHLVIRTAVPLGTVGSAVRQAVESVDKDVPVNLFAMEKLSEESLAPGRFRALLLGSLALLALVLAMVGTYGVMAYSVSERTREIGIRMALGAQKADVLKMVIANGAKLALTGVGIGVVGALILTRFLASMLYGVHATDPGTFVVVSLVLICVALVACYIPARRATKVDPMVALRYE